MFQRILIANRGEIACRIIRTARKLGIETIAIYSDADCNALHVKQADQAFHIGEAPSQKSYLNIEAIIKAAVQSKAQAIHPGYGFLSENAEFAAACQQAGIVFIGPSVDALNAMASKQLAKQILEKTSVPLTPGYHGKEQSEKKLIEQAKKIGFPVLLKAAAGGGGKGMRSVHDINAFSSALASAKREAKASFGDDTMIIEKLVANPRHIEVQIMADEHGQVVHLFERDCSIQRRHQKVIEEAPAPKLSETLRKKITHAAVEVALAIHYTNAGTVEFLVDQDQFYFMEMNTRLQVEHPVTEMVTGLDLVEWQLRIASGEVLPKQQDEIDCQGHAIECRIYAEDPNQDFMPSIGRIDFLKEPQGQNIRIDTGVMAGSDITMHYDPMIAKLIAYGSSRTQAAQVLQQALKHYPIGGVKTNIPFLMAIVQHSDFLEEKLSTDFLNRLSFSPKAIAPETVLLWSVCADYLAQYKHLDPISLDTFAWKMNQPACWPTNYLFAGEILQAHVYPLDANHLRIHFENQVYDIQTWQQSNILCIDNGQQHTQVMMENHDKKMVFYHDGMQYDVHRYIWQQQSNNPNALNDLMVAPMPATVVAILKHQGDEVKSGDQIMVLEAMKMEHAIIAPRDGLLREIYYEVGSQVNEGAELAELEAQSP